MDVYAFSLGQPVRLAMSGEKGKVVGRFESVDHPPQYSVRYVAGDGRQVTGWFWASEIYPCREDSSGQGETESVVKEDTPTIGGSGGSTSPFDAIFQRLEKLEAQVSKNASKACLAFDTVSFSRYPTD